MSFIAAVDYQVDITSATVGTTCHPSVLCGLHPRTSLDHPPRCKVKPIAPSISQFLRRRQWASRGQALTTPQELDGQLMVVGSGSVIVLGTRARAKLV